MSTVLKVQSFSESNIRERSLLAATLAVGSQTATFESTQGFETGQPIYVGVPGNERCEKLVVQAVLDATRVQFVAPAAYEHKTYEPVLGVLGDLIKIYRALNVDGRAPADEMFTVLATRNIDSDQPMTYYTDSSGSANYWYKYTYFNQLTNAETSLADSVPVRGDDFGHYATLSAIRSEAGFANATNLSDVDVDQQRRAAETEINATLANYYATPFKPVPDAVRVLTEKLAAAFLKYNAYGSKYQKLVDEARASVQLYANQGSSITDDEGNSLSTTEGVSYDFGDQPRMFEIGQKF
jgi:hypothetical protein